MGKGGFITGWWPAAARNVSLRVSTTQNRIGPAAAKGSEFLGHAVYNILPLPKDMQNQWLKSISM